MVKIEGLQAVHSILSSRLKGQNGVAKPTRSPRTRTPRKRINMVNIRNEYISPHVRLSKEEKTSEYLNLFGLRYLAQNIIKKYLINIRNLSLTVLEVEVQDQDTGRRAAGLQRVSLYCNSYGGRNNGVLWDLFCKGTNSIDKDSLS
jgi:hypothetical protein